MCDSKLNGSFLKLSIGGASHSKSIRFALENFPSSFSVDCARLAKFMERRAPGRDSLSTQRQESDEVEFVSGLVAGRTTGGVIRGRIANRDMRPADYARNREIPRPGHADFGQWVQLGRIPTGGGSNSGRLTAAMCAAGGLCLQLLERRGIFIKAKIDSIGGKNGGSERVIKDAMKRGDSVGGIVSCSISGLPPGLGGALFDGVESALSAALFSIPGVKGVEFGLGFACAALPGSEVNDCFAIRKGEVVTLTNRLGGVMGGRTCGSPVEFRVAFRPTPTLYLPQQSVDLVRMRSAECVMKGRHDPCIVRRAVPVVEAIAAFAIADLVLADEAAHPRICLTLTGPTLSSDLGQYCSQRYFVDMVELRADLLEESELVKVAEFPSSLPFGVKALLTMRRKCDGGAYSGSEKRRLAFFRRVLGAATSAGRGFDYIDLEDDFHDVGLEALARSLGVRIVRSLHIFDVPIGNVPSILRRLVGKRDEIAKLAFMPRDLGDVSRVFAAVQDNPSLPPHVICAMGPVGIATRVLAGRLGSLWTYSSLGGLEGLGHISPQELVRDYRFRSISRDAVLFGVTGWPLEKTCSPEINNAAFAAEDVDAVMLPMPAKSAREAMAFFNAMDMRGMAVTIPHKLSVVPFLDGIDRSARAVGAVNTVSRKGNRLIGSNTDADGFSESFSAFAGDVRGKRVALLGAGGAARAVAVALKRLGAKATVFHRRTPPKGFDILVNATPVDPIPDYSFCGNELVYDLRYVPAITPLMARAISAGCRAVNGLGMLRAQACGQRRLWEI